MEWWRYLTADGFIVVNLSSPPVFVFVEQGVCFLDTKLTANLLPSPDFQSVLSIWCYLRDAFFPPFSVVVTFFILDILGSEHLITFHL